MSEAHLERVVDFLYELGLLKRARRTGWWVAGIDDPESVAEHSFRTALVGYVLAHLEGADPGRTVLMCLLHDTQETRVGDIPAIGRRYLQAAANTAVTADQTSGFPPHLLGALRDLVEEYEGRESAESRIAHDADKLELVLQSREYQAQGGHDTGAWLRSSVDALRTPVARELAEVACRIAPERWWQIACGTGPAPEAESPEP